VQYEEALKEWGALRLERYYRDQNGPIDRSSVVVAFDFYEGFACCGGSNPGCYCSFAEPPRAEVVVTGTSADGQRCRDTIYLEDFDFGQVLKEIVIAGGGQVTCPTDA
jgi:hypothetical protein